jgi:hypothetical protein
LGAFGKVRATLDGVAVPVTVTSQGLTLRLALDGSDQDLRIFKS